MAPHLSSHHQQVAYLSFRIAEELALPYEQIKSVFLAALVHDIGALSINEKLTLIDAEPFNANEHAFRSAKLFENFIPMRSAAPVIRYHHLPWDHGNGTQYQGKPVPYECHILHLADRVCANLQNNHYDITHIQQLIDNLGKQSSESFDPKLIEVIRKLAKKEYIWLDLISHSPIHNILELGVFDVMLANIDDILALSEIFAQIIDFRSSFTARHSAGVASSAAALAELLRFSAYECKMMEIAGYLHDLGKIVIPEEILEKPGPLTEDEFSIIRSHSYYTYQLLQPIKQFHSILLWASYHHEKPNGSGYPFHIKETNLPLGARIIAVADVFTALKEDRPYRKGMDNEQTKQILLQMAAERCLDENVVCTLMEHFGTVNSARTKGQYEAAIRYGEFLRSDLHSL